MKIGVLTIGNELISGRIADTNTSTIARLTWQMNWPLVVSLCVGDDDDMISRALSFALSHAQAVVVTGGLGPTSDDITTAAIAKALNLSLYTDEEVLGGLRDLFQKYNLTWTENNAKQAVFPVGAEILPNPIGTAPGFALRYQDRHIFVIPGVPREAERMMRDQVIPRLLTYTGEEKAFPWSRTLKTFGLSEAAVDEALKDIDFRSMGISIGFYPHFPENHIVISTVGEKDEAKERLAQGEREITARLGRYIFAYDGETLEGNIGALLRKLGLTIAVAESCTGGLITDRLTDIPGSSDYVERGFVTYSNRAKTELLGVSPETIKRFGAVSEETAREMAQGARNKAQTHLGLAVTGIAGPTGGSEEKPVGTVFIAISDDKGTSCRRHQFRWERRRNKIITATTALFTLLNHLKNRHED
ncbi:MAG TPA: competence/damage-inducible protein A [Syntrophales bacterium]|nr:competence/damage-inducible protein A [Syntrophales bacterium]HOL59049.1 competence/damage-inducible protein A [Syntrophales bacterium]HPO35442.1 competence/damage-inducible protein A [Syntrophales bacterium]